MSIFKGREFGRYTLQGSIRINSHTLEFHRALLCINGMILGKFLSLSEPQFPQPSDGDNKNVTS